MSVPRCGSIILDLALKFNTTTKEQDVITTLNDALKNGKLGEFSVGAIKGKTPTPTDSSYKNFWQLINECPCRVLDWKHIFWCVKCVFESCHS